MHGISKWFGGVVLTVALALPAAAADKKTERLWKAKCSGCHGMDGKAQTEKGQKMKMADMTSPEFQKGKDDDWKKAIAEGTKAEKDGVKKEMDPFKDELKAPEIDALIGYVRSLAAK